MRGSCKTSDVRRGGRFGTARPNRHTVPKAGQWSCHRHAVWRGRQ